MYTCVYPYMHIMCVYVCICVATYAKYLTCVTLSVSEHRIG